MSSYLQTKLLAVSYVPQRCVSEVITREVPEDDVLAEYQKDDEHAAWWTND